jgi:hypothetical protein
MWYHFGIILIYHFDTILVLFLYHHYSWHFDVNLAIILTPFYCDFGINIVIVILVSYAWLSL